MGWGNHEGLWRGHEPAVGQRSQEVARMYNASTLDDITPLLDRYHVKYVAVGELERKDYQAAGLEKFAQLTVAFSHGGDDLSAMSRMRILIALTYYRPHVSGLSIYAERLARGLARHGHTVTVLTSRFHPSLPARERRDGVDVIRVPVATKVSKGAIMPLFPLYAARLVRRHDVVNIHMPQFEAALLAFLGRIFGKGVVLTYQCDLKLPAGVFNRLVQWSLGPLNHLAARLAHRVVTTTEDYAQHSSFLRQYAHKLTVIPPLIDIPPADPAVTHALAERWHFNGRPQIGFAARFAAEKGVEYLLQALPAVLERGAGRAHRLHRRVQGHRR